MHDPMVVAHEIPRPWPQRTSFGGGTPDRRWEIRHHHRHWPDPTNAASCDGCLGAGEKWFPWWRLHSYSKFWTLAGRRFYWPSLITVWHVEPGGRDSGEVCKHQSRWQDGSGKWHAKPLRGWRWHVHHWKIQVHGLQHLRRWLLTRCAWCGGRSVKGAQVNCSMSWDGPRGKWWKGEPGLFHSGCSSVYQAHRTCICDNPGLLQGDYGTCVFCGLSRSWRSQPTPEFDQATRILAALPTGARLTPEVKAQVDPLWKAGHERQDAYRKAQCTDPTAQNGDT